MSKQSFIHLDVKSDFSFFHGASKVGDLASRAAELGMPALALTDSNNLYGAFDFSKKAADKGVQPIVGVELLLGYSAPDRRGVMTKRKGSVLALAQNEQGYQNLCALVSKATEPRKDAAIPGLVNPRDLMGLNEGVILLSGSDDGILYTMLRDGLEEEPFQMAGFLQKVFRDRFYIQISRGARRMTEEAAAVEEKLLAIAYDDRLGFPTARGGKFVGVPIVGSTPVRYTTRERHETWEMLRAIADKRHLQYREGELVTETGMRLHMRSSDEVRNLFEDLPEAFENTIHLARRCAFRVEQRKPLLPPFDSGAGRGEVEELRHQAEVGLRERLQKEGITASDEIARYEERLRYELDVIVGMGFPGYFLIVADFIKWARDNSIPVGPGRGSGAGSVVAWALTITDLNPFRFGLLFERFLNPDRVSMPDFDIDFCQDRREEVINYVARKYGLSQVAQIANFGEIKSKTALKDASRVMVDDAAGGFSFPEVNEITQLIPRKEDSAEPKSLKDAYESNPDLAQRVNQSPKLKLLYKKATNLEGLYRSQGMHAAGIVIADRPLHELAPMGWDDETGLPVTQFNMKAAESVGLVKFDFLGLKTLSVIQKAVDLIEEFQGTKIDIESIPMDDQRVFEMLAEGKTIGVFQFESAGMQRALRQVEPTRVEDLIAVNALYRPGPMEMIPQYARCKKGEEQPHYPDPVDKTKPFLEETYGIMVYQEQVMQVAQVVAGYSLGQADILRRAMGKKIKAEMDAQKETFIKGATERGTSPEAAADLFHHIEKFASYGFNKSHAAAYAVIAYRTAWLKRHYPVEFFSALLSYETDKPEKMADIREDMENHPDGAIELLPPDICRSRASFRPERSGNRYGVRFGLAAIKSISGDLHFLAEEQEKGAFKDLKDFYRRVGRNFNKSQLSRLVEAGAFDCLEQTRARADSVLGWLSKHMKTDLSQNDLFSDAEVTVPPRVLDVLEWGDLSDREFRAVGFWFGKHPLDNYTPRLMRSKVRRRKSYISWLSERRMADMRGAYLCGLVEEVRIRESRNKNMYILIKLAERDDDYLCTFFPQRNGPGLYDIFDRLEAAQRARKPIVLQADLALEEDDNLRIFARQVIDIDEFLKGLRGMMQISISAEDIILTNEEYDQLGKYAENDPDRDRVYAKAMRRKLNEVWQVLTSIRDDESKTAVPLVLDVNVPGYTRDVAPVRGRYLFTPAVENRLKSMDGVVSIREMDRPLPPPRPQEPDEGPYLEQDRDQEQEQETTAASPFPG